MSNIKICQYEGKSNQDVCIQRILCSIIMHCNVHKVMIFSESLGDTQKCCSAGDVYFSQHLYSAMIHDCIVTLPPPSPVAAVLLILVQ